MSNPAPSTTFSDDHIPYPKKAIYTRTYGTFSPSLIFTHGFGGSLSSASMHNFASGFSSTSSVLCFEGSMKLPRRISQFHAVLTHTLTSQTETQPQTQDSTPPKPIALGGRSMGARAAVILANELSLSQSTFPSATPSPPTHLILISYPLRNEKGEIRDQILYSIPVSTEVLFISGERDTMCPAELIDEVRRRMGARTWMVWVRGANHGMDMKPADATLAAGETTGRVAAEWLREREEGVGDGGTAREIRWDEGKGEMEEGEWHD
ncbi:MAG: hypothetical protein M1820_005166 [Bogoriella megaspora]|nr:MAG: hypothetical protein M1820_005166 [Bogoriella megaspora]